MSLDKRNTWNSLDSLWRDKNVKTLDSSDRKYAIISDTHMGDGGEADDFHLNEPAMLHALDHYFRKGYTLILLGDIEEFWQFDLPAIRKEYEASVYSKIRAFGEDRVYRIFGNHDFEWGGFRDPTRVKGKMQGLADEALKMKDASGKVKVLLVHGHQGSIDSDKYSWFSRFFVRVFRGIEPLAKITGLYGHGAATKSPVASDYERTYYAWAKNRRVIVFCGHSHRAVFASKTRADELLDKIADLTAELSDSRLSRSTLRKKNREIARIQAEFEDEKAKGRAIEIDSTEEPKPCYFNTGCGLYSDGITTIEIADDQVRLVKWNRDATGGKQSVVFKEGSLSQFVKEVSS